MTREEHIAEAERLLAWAETYDARSTYGAVQDRAIAKAQAHATIAVAMYDGGS